MEHLQSIGDVLSSRIHDIDKCGRPYKISGEPGDSLTN